MKFSRISFVYILGFFVLYLSGFSTIQAQKKAEYMRGEIIVKYRKFLPEIAVGKQAITTKRDSVLQRLDVAHQDSSRGSEPSMAQAGIPINPHLDAMIVAIDQEIGVIKKQKVFPNFSASDTLSFDRKGRLVKLIDLSRTYKIVIPKNANIDSTIKKYQSLPQVEYAEPVFYGYAQQIVPNDNISLQYGMNQANNYDIDAFEAWDIETGSNDVIVAVLDSGIDYTLTDFYGNISSYPNNKVVAGYDYVNSDADPFDDNTVSHGTRVAGIIGALTNNNKDIFGVAGGWNTADLGCRIMPIKVIDDQGISAHTWIAQGLDFARQNGADVINMSVGRGGFNTQTLHDALWNAHNAGIVLVAAIGNDNKKEFIYPAAWSEMVISVGGMDENGNRYDLSSSNGSNYGEHIDFTGPAVQVYSITAAGVPRTKLDGTSFATPHVAGIAALLKSVYGFLHTGDVEEILKRTAMKLPTMDPSGYDIYFGHGLPKARAALDYILTTNQFIHGSVTTSANGNTGTYSVNLGHDGIPHYNTTLTNISGTTLMKRYERTATVSFGQSFTSVPEVWVRSNDTKGWPFFAGGPEPGVLYFNDNYAEVVPGTLTKDGCTFRTYVYEVFNVTTGGFIGWYPTTPGNANISYTAMGPVEGTQFLADDFDDGNADGWSVGAGGWNASGNRYEHTGSGDGFTTAGSTSWSNYTTEFKHINAKDGGVLLCAQDMNNAIALIVRPTNNDIYWHVRQNGNWGPQYNSQTLGHGPGSTLDVKVVADNGTFTAYVNGVQKTSFTNSTFPGGKIGFYSWSGTPGQAFDDVFVTAGVNGNTGGSGSGGSLPSPWVSTDIGSVNTTGSATHSNGTFTIKGSGVDIWDYNDGFHFMHQPLSGNGSISARIVSQDNTNNWAKSGVMIRESAADNSPHAMMALTPANGTILQGRQNGGSNSVHPASSSGGTPRWVKLERNGNTFTGYVSSNNGASWDAIGSMTASMGNNVMMGLCVTSHNNGVLNTTVFDNVSINGSGGSSGGGNNTIVNGNFDNGFNGWTATGSWKINGAWTIENGYPQPGQIGDFAGSFPPESGTGTLTSDSFVINKNYINFRVGGQDNANANKVRLIVGGSIVKETGPPGDNGFVDRSWSVSNWMNQSAYIECVDGNSNGGYAWYCVDEFRLDDSPSGPASKPVVLAQNTPVFRSDLPDTFRVNQNVPNPFNPETTIVYDLPRDADVSLKIYNVLGQEVRSLVSDRMPAGRHRIVWNSQDELGRVVSSGIYFYRFVAGPVDDTKKMLILK